MLALVKKRTIAHDSPLRSDPFWVRITGGYLAPHPSDTPTQIFAFGKNFRYPPAVRRNWSFSSKEES